MLTGKHFTLNRDTIALATVDGHPKAVVIPAGIVIQVVADPKPNCYPINTMVEVLWEGQTVTMFALDIQDRGKVVVNKSAGS